jgi:hypothetical protein
MAVRCYGTEMDWLGVYAPETMLIYTCTRLLFVHYLVHATCVYSKVTACLNVCKKYKSMCYKGF